MPYPRENLGPKEEVVLDLHPHWWTITPSILALVASVVLGLVAIAGNWPGPAKIGIAVLVLVTLIWFGWRELQLITTNFVLTTDRVIYRFGVVSKRGVEIPLERINAITFEQAFWERILGLGDLVIQSAAEGSDSRFENVRKPNKVQTEIYRQMEDNENRKYDRIGGHVQAAAAGAMQQQPAPAESIPDQITKLAALRDQGHITPEEFEAKKAELLGRM